MRIVVSSIWTDLFLKVELSLWRRQEGNGEEHQLQGSTLEPSQQESGILIEGIPVTGTAHVALQATPHTEEDMDHHVIRHMTEDTGIDQGHLIIIGTGPILHMEGTGPILHMGGTGPIPPTGGTGPIPPTGGTGPILHTGGRGLILLTAGGIDHHHHIGGGIDQYHHITGGVEEVIDRCHLIRIVMFLTAMLFTLCFIAMLWNLTCKQCLSNFYSNVSIW
eukprot:TRINITY_DN185_c0_g1_i2.p2 TRINITY_DN185_c0_g1~~TRINITY_DN185_c0_g1_i2.p2  ORF type:complete len:220 (+),score=8.26 TRINITY_DN185_c0_g1_i2:613-1272(+)